MHLHAAQPDIFQFAGAGIDAFDALKLDAEFILVSARCDFRVGVRVNVWIYPHCDGGNFLEPCGDAVDAQNFRFTFDIKRINSLAQGKFNFSLGLGHPCKNALARVAARRMARCNSPPLTMSKPPPRFEIVRSTARFEFDFIAKQIKWSSGASA